MHPPWSMVFFTTLIGAAQGLLLALVGLDLARALGLLAFARALPVLGCGLVLLLGLLGLFAASFHLGHPMRAWRAGSQWRTSWLSREVIVMPVFLASVALWGIAHHLGLPTVLPGMLAGLLALLLYLCTGMIYGAVRAMRAWAHPITPVNFLLLGTASGFTLASALSSIGAPALSGGLARVAIGLIVLGALTRGYAWRRAVALAGGPAAPDPIGAGKATLRLVSAGATGSTFIVREFFHGRSPAAVTAVQSMAALAGFGIPLVLLGVAQGRSDTGGLPLLAFGVQYLGLLAERWSFFAEARHPATAYQHAPV